MSKTTHLLLLQLRLRNDLYCVEWGVKLYSLLLLSNHLWASVNQRMLTIGKI